MVWYGHETDLFAWLLNKLFLVVNTGGCPRDAISTCFLSWAPGNSRRSRDVALTRGYHQVASDRQYGEIHEYPRMSDADTGSARDCELEFPGEFLFDWVRPYVSGPELAAEANPVGSQ